MDRSSDRTGAPDAAASARGLVATALALALLVTVVAGGAGALVGGGGEGAAAGDGAASVVQPEGFASAQAVDADRVLLRATVDESGDASWRVEYRVRLDTEDREAAFEDLEADVAENESDYAARFEERMAATAATAENATGREMTVGNTTVTTAREQFPEETGLLVYEYEWTGFAAASDGRLEMGDALGGLYLEEGYALTIRWPEGYERGTASPQPDASDERSVTWRGPRDFSADEPRVTAARPSVLDGGGTAVAGAVVVALVAGLLYWRREWVRNAAGLGDGAAKGEGGGGGGESEGSGGESEGGEEGDGGAAGAAAAAGGAEEPEASEPPEELLSNEERVLRLLERNGGRMKQQDVVSELDWTDARTSQVVSGLREDGKLESFRLGRENVLRLPEADEAGPAGDADEGRDDGGDA
ncbi:hypothetical protein GCM10027435_23690 [Haloparvum alkalitolerans]|uniref:helix-turn-helix transcriptional regulator n=1 Tax=Haloparvum alkalitolerans TaxID=1042953 RepID=UPI003CE6D120